MPAFILCAAVALLSGIEASAQSCDMIQIAQHVENKIYSSKSGLPALFFTADMDVNTDGAARSYHPDDPRGERLAFNNMGNAISKMFDAKGRDITCEPRQNVCFTRFIQTFEAARDAGYAPTGAPRIETKKMIPWRMDPATGWKKPCTIQGGPHAGYFISQTAVIVDDTRAECDQARYLDSLTINANVLPQGIKWQSQGVTTDKTDLVVARDRQTGRIAFAINGDYGPADKIGEGSIALAAALSGTALTGQETYQKIKSLKRSEVDYLIFPNQDIRRLTGGRFTQADIDRLGKMAFEKWGGLARLNACQALPR